MHDRAGAEEQVGLEHAVHEQVEDREHIARGTQSGADEHVADLAHRGAGQCLLDLVLGGRDPGAHDHGDHTHGEHDRDGSGAQVEDRVAANDQVDTRGDHGRGMDQGGHRGRALHRVEQPRLQRELGRLTDRGQQQRQPDQGQGGLARLRGGLEDRFERDRAERDEHQHHGDAQSDVAHAVHHEGLLGGHCCFVAVLPEADQQVRGQTDALPPEVKQQVVVGHDEQEHRGHEQVQIAHEPSFAGVLSHVAERVDVDQRADAGDEHDERDRQRVQAQRELDIEGAGEDPVPHVEHDQAVRLRQSHHLGE